MNGERKIVRGARRCFGCGYRLSGQPTVREPHYDLVTIRCPECGLPACVLDHAMFGHRLRALAPALGAAWTAVSLGLWFLTGLVLFALIRGTTEGALGLYRRQIRDWFDPPQGGVRPVDIEVIQIAVNPGPGGTQPFEQWWTQQDHAAMLAAVGGWTGAVNWWAFLAWIPAGLVAMTLGAFWSVLMARSGRLLRSVLLPVLLVVPMVFTGQVLAELRARPPYWTGEAAFSQIGLPVSMVCFGFAAVALGLGLLIGRRLARGLIRATVPPRYRGGFAALWMVDGRTPPLGLRPR